MNELKTFGVQLIVRHRNKKSPMAGIYLRITVNGRRTEISTKLSCPATQWDGDKERVKSGDNFPFNRTNQMLEQLKGKVISIYQELLIREEHISVTAIKNRFLGIKEEGHTLQKLIDYHYQIQENALNSATLNHYKTTARYLKEFLLERRGVDDIYLNKIDYRFLTDFEAFLRNYQPVDAGKKSIGHNTVMRHLSRVRTYANLAVRLGWIQSYPFSGYKLNFKQTSRRYLSKEELQRLEEKEFSIARLRLTRDLFLFSCYTGLAYVDISLLTPDNLSIGIDGNNWIYTQRKKTENMVRVPLLPVAAAMIEKYRNHPRAVHSETLFPGMSNQRLNCYLKEIADLCEIDKNLTFHMARHTFATTVTLSNGVPIETVSKILGHNRIATTQIYAKVVENKVSEDMQKLQHKLNDQMLNLNRTSG
ncbi:site-specific integrase [Marinilabiliaceae bacterium JC017]|nr:site-specific integrase [Marinilabiliaceae bacterium JC017]